jgi:pimeloyl-ACP methyl ester carboxylesterase
LSALTPSVREWRDGGRLAEYRGYSIHLRIREGTDPVLLFLHGFPSSSYDWRFLLEEIPDPAAVTFDFLGFGLSDKPREHSYSLFWQADLTEDIIRREARDRPVFVVAHDMATSVATELMARDLEGRLEARIAGILLFNGSVVLERASPTLGERLLSSRFGALAARLTNKPVFRHQLGSVFSPGHPLSDEEAADQWSVFCHNGARTLGHRLNHYMEERVTHAKRWHGAVRDWPGRLCLAWGMLDPVATPDVLAALRGLRPAVLVEELPDLGHYPQLEDPGALAGAVRRCLVQATSS